MPYLVRNFLIVSATPEKIETMKTLNKIDGSKFKSFQNKIKWRETCDDVRVVGEDLEGGGEGLLVDALGVVGGWQAALLLLPTEAHRVHLEHRLDVNLEKNANPHHDSRNITKLELGYKLRDPTHL